MAKKVKKALAKKVAPKKQIKKNSVTPVQVSTVTEKKPIVQTPKAVVIKDIDPLENEILNLLQTTPEGILQTEIYQKIGIEKRSKTMLILAKLAKNGDIKRQREGRSFLVTLS
jgi:uncharacterized membrane protein